MAHVPGPYRYMRAIDGSGYFGIIDAQGYLLAEVFRQIGKTTFCDAEPQARLFAAAPQLYAACDAYVAADRLEAETGERKLVERAYRDAVALARAAIASVRDGEPVENDKAAVDFVMSSRARDFGNAADREFEAGVDAEAARWAEEAER